MIKLLVGSAFVSLTLAIGPAIAQSAPPPGVAQGTSPLQPSLIGHVPPVILTSRVMSVSQGARVLTRDEMLRHVREMFARLDTNHDGFISRDEIAAFGHKMHAMRVTADGGEQFQERRFERRQGAVRAEDRAALFDKLDTNHDGVISRREFMAARPELREHRVVVMRNDSETSAKPNGEGRMHEMHMREMGLRGGFAAHLFAMADANHDGRVSLQEAETAALAHFDRMDLNHDRKITPDERREAHERMRGEHHPF
jgi:hypothetical protein